MKNKYLLQGQGKNWIISKNQHNDLQITNLNHKYFRTHLEDSLSLGRPLLIEDVEEELDPVLNNLLERNVIKQGKVEKLIKMFNLPENTTRVRKEMATSGGAFGQLHVTNTHLCFVGALGKKLCVPIASITELTKAKRFFLSPGHGHSLHVTTSGGKYDFHGIKERDACAKAIEKLCNAAGNKVTIVDKTK